MRPAAPPSPRSKEAKSAVSTSRPLRIYPHGVNRGKLETVIRDLSIPVEIVREPNDADMVLTLKNYYRQKASSLNEAAGEGVPIYVLKSNTEAQMEQLLSEVFEMSAAQPEGIDPVQVALYETEEAIRRVFEGGAAQELTPQNAYIRRMQHMLAERYNLESQSKGREPFRHIRISMPGR